METQYLQYFVSVAKHLSFIRAAEENFVSQPALSAQIKKFEGILGCPLFLRSKRSVQLTPEGQALLPKAISILAEMRSIRDLAKELKDPFRGTIRLGFSSLVSLCKTFRGIKTLEDVHPKLEITFEEDDSSSLLERLRLGDLDIILVPYFPDLEGKSLVWKEFETYSLVHVAPKRAMRKKNTFISLQTKCPVTVGMEAGAKAMGGSTKSPIMAQEIAVVKRLVEVGAGWSVLPESSLNENDRKNLTVTPIPGHSVRHLVVVPQGPRSEALLELFYQELLPAKKAGRDRSVSKKPVVLNGGFAHV